jgi:phosphopantothenoylcysteine decarboxylase/phosphopantothenate--cysteine ligase
MDEDMWKHPGTKRNINTLADYGVEVLDVADGLLASGLSGKGRMMEPEEIVKHLAQKLQPPAKGLFSGKKVLITAGPTYEPIDPVRFIGNHSTGRMGIELANSFIQHGAIVELVLGPTQLEVPKGIGLSRVTTAIEMHDTVVKKFPEADFVICSAAVADYRPSSIREQKIKKQEASQPPQIDLVENPDILKYCGHHKRSDQVVVGFALETNNERQHALEKMTRKQANMMVLNSLRDKGAGFGKSTNKVTLFSDKGLERGLQLAEKSEIARQIVASIAEYANL